MVATTRSTESRLDSLEKAVEDLSSAVQDIRAFQTSTEASNASTAAKLDALLKKFSISLETEESEGSQSTGEEQSVPLPIQKMDLPGFDGSEALSWLARAEQYFLVHNIPVDQHVKIVLIAMSGSAMSWIQILLRCCLKLTWSQFSQQLLTCFGDGSTVNGFEPLFTTTHTGSLKEYIFAFEERVSQLLVLSDELYLGAFLGGLKKEIRVRLQDATLTDHPAAINIAKKLKLVHPTHQSSSPSRPVVFSPPSI